MSHSTLIPASSKCCVAAYNKPILPLLSPNYNPSLCILSLFPLFPFRQNPIYSQQSPQTSLNMAVRTPTRLTRSSPANIKKFEFDRVQRFHQRLLFRSKRSSRALSLQPKPRKTVSFLLPEQPSKCDVHHQRWGRVLRQRTRTRENSLNLQVESLRRPSKTFASSDRFQECSICAESKGK